MFRDWRDGREWIAIGDIWVLEGGAAEVRLAARTAPHGCEARRRSKVIATWRRSRRGVVVGGVVCQRRGQVVSGESAAYNTVRGGVM